MRIFNHNLLKHYLTTAHLSFCQDARLAPLWRDVIPDCAFSHEYLMHGLLAVSALHYGHANQSHKQTYSLLSARHQALALNWFSAQLRNDIINEDNYKAQIFLGSIVFIFPVFAVAEAGREGRPVSTHDVVQAFVLLKGECLPPTPPPIFSSILDTPPPMTSSQWVAGGGECDLLAALTKASVPAAAADVVEPDEPAGAAAGGEFVRQLETTARGAVRAIIAADHQQAVVVCEAAVEALRETYARVMAAAPAPGRMADGIWIWPLLLPEPFVALIAEGHPAALVVLAHFAALMRCCEVYWWSEGWSESVVDMIVARLEARALAWVEWPVTCVRNGIDVRTLA
ncbi:hypothetical protein SLS58_005508 [Diplodia intermedia]|uniref:Uncharacterized protein n=1 Tax=Diplodia intermedia TaxID=856260 RepID=A0ABR3TQQ1_9PEZI